MPSIKRSLSATPTPPPTSSPPISSADSDNSTPSPKKVKSTKPTLSTPKTPQTPRVKAEPGTKTKKTPKAGAKAGSSGSSASGSDAASGKKMGAWSGEELKMLYHIMCPKQTGVNWADVAGQIDGRDGKSCKNKWTRMQGKLEQAIEEMGE